MRVTGNIIAVLPPLSGVSARTGNPWKTQMYVLETVEQYPKKIPFEIYGDDRITQFNILPNEQNVTIEFDIEGSEYNGKWYVKLRCYNVVRNNR